MYFYFLPMAKDAPYLSYLDKDVIRAVETKKRISGNKKSMIMPDYNTDIQFE